MFHCTHQSRWVGQWVGLTSLSERAWTTRTQDLGITLFLHFMHANIRGMWPSGGTCEVGGGEVGGGKVGELETFLSLRDCVCLCCVHVCVSVCAYLIRKSGLSTEQTDNGGGHHLQRVTLGKGGQEWSPLTSTNR